MEDVVKSFMPDSIIHTAAITNVDYCELNPELCHKVNVLGTQNIFDVAKNINAHFSYFLQILFLMGLREIIRKPTKQTL